MNTLMTQRHNNGKKARWKTWLVSEERLQSKCTKPKRIPSMQKKTHPYIVVTWTREINSRLHPFKIPDMIDNSCPSLSLLGSASGWAHTFILLASFILTLSTLSRERRGQRGEAQAPVKWLYRGRHVQAEDSVWRLSGRRQKPLR